MNPSSPITSSAGNSRKQASISPYQSRQLDCPFNSKVSSLESEALILRPSIHKDTEDFLKHELSVSRLNKISKYLWLAGSGKVRSLHHQIVMEREIIITESVELHLCWQRARMYIKPLPRFLLDRDFFDANLCSTTNMEDEEWTLHANACGFLKSYTQLIVHQSDFKIAQEKMLIPEELTWNEWRQYSAEVDKYIYDHKGQLRLNSRYNSGELRIQRLNFVYKLRMREARGFHYSYTSYETFFRTNFGWMALVFASFSIILSALQTSLTTSNATENHPLHMSAYWFAVVVLLVVVGSIVSIVALFVIMFLDNLVFAVKPKRGIKKPSISNSGATSNV